MNSSYMEIITLLGQLVTAKYEQRFAILGAAVVDKLQHLVYCFSS
jgi:hypothetical protein